MSNEKERIKVSVLSHTDNIDHVIAIAANTCYSKKTPTELHNSFDLEKAKAIIEKCWQSGHHSVFEHGSITFAIENVSRSLLAQITRHRIASFSVQSQRYCDMSEIDINKMALPAKCNETTISHFVEAYNHSIDMYNFVKKNDDVPNEDARYVLPEGSPTNIVMTMNCRSLFNFFSLRCCTCAQHEIRYVANEMLKLSKEIAPLTFEHAGAFCEQKGYCCEEVRSCHKKPTLTMLLSKFESPAI